ncbi:hypothetical protein ACFWXO_31935 [Kitasatospora sp. NPDC059088]|uniref:hypothetical protein n=1 Tax=Kitasatospora sp. NPDC059088 TaxID=3346722 RepID=UPI0036CA429A
MPSAASGDVPQALAALPQLMISPHRRSDGAQLLTANVGGHLLLHLKDGIATVTGREFTTAAADRLVNALLGPVDRYVRADGTRSPSLADVDTSRLRFPDDHVQCGIQRADRTGTVHRACVYRGPSVRLAFRPLPAAEVLPALKALAT